jgi:hypothetical protein
MLYTIINSPEYMRLPIQASKEVGCYESILSRIARLMRDMTSSYNRVLFSKFSICFPYNQAYPQDNHNAVIFMNRLTTSLNMNGQYGKYAWVYSKSDKDRQQSYIMCLWTDARAVATNESILRYANNLWCGILGVAPSNMLIVPDDVVGHGIILDKSDINFNNNFSASYEIASHLALVDVKGHAPDRVREFGSTNRPPSQDHQYL